jgi:ribosome assembly protein RRB1
LSFGLVKDSLGAPRRNFPHTAFLVAGTQAAPGTRNFLSVMKLASLTQGEHGKKVSTEERLDDGFLLFNPS